MSNRTESKERRFQIIRWALLIVLPGLLIVSSLTGDRNYGLLNIWYIIGFIQPITYQAIMAAYISSFWFDFTHALSTLIFLVVLAKPWIKKLERIKTKFGLLESEKLVK